MTVRDLKFAICSSNCGLLPGVISLSFWGVQLVESERFFEYGIPEWSEITVSENVIGEVHVTFENTEVLFRYGADTIDSLMEVLRFNFPILPSAVQLMSDGIKVSGSRLVSDFVELGIRPYEIELAIEFWDGIHRQNFPMDDTVGQARAALMQQFRGTEVVVVVGDTIVSDDCPLTQCCDDDFHVFLRRRHRFVMPQLSIGCVQEEVFESCCTVRNAKQRLAVGLSVNGESLVMMYQGRALKDDCLLAQFAPENDVVVYIRGKMPAPLLSLKAPETVIKKRRKPFRT
jgi:hypothetical protein